MNKNKYLLLAAPAFFNPTFFLMATLANTLAFFVSTTGLVFGVRSGSFDLLFAALSARPAEIAAFLGSTKVGFLTTTFGFFVNFVFPAFGATLRTLLSSGDFFVLSVLAPDLSGDRDLRFLAFLFFSWLSSLYRERSTEIINKHAL